MSRPLELAGMRPNPFESFEYDPIPGRMLDDIDDAEATLKDMEDTISAAIVSPTWYLRAFELS